MSKIRVDQLETLDGVELRNVADLITSFSDGTVTTSTGTQALSVALDDRVNKGAIGSETLTTDTGSQTLINALDQRSITETADVTVTIPSDYSTLQAAIDDLSTRTLAQGSIVDLVIETGHNLTAGISVSDGDYSHFRVSSQDAEVTLTASFTSADFIYATRAKAPVLNCLINSAGNCDNGYNIENGSYGAANPGCGVKNCNIHGLRVFYSSVFDGQGTVWDGGGATGDTDGGSCVTFWGSVGNVRSCSAINSGYYGIQSAASSAVDARSSSSSGAARHGLRATNGSIAVFRDCTATNCGVVGVYALQGSVIDAMGANVSGANVRGCQATLGSLINFENGVADNVGSGTPGTAGEYGLYAFRASKINARSASVQACLGEYVIWADAASEINADGVDITASDTVHGIAASQTSTVNAPLADFTNSTASNFAVYSFRGSLVNVEAAVMGGSTSAYVAESRDGSNITLRDMAGAHTSSGIRVTRGSFVSAHDNVYAVSQTLNTVTSDGIIFR